MKKKLLILLLLPIMFLGFDDVLADSTNTCKPVSPSFFKTTGNKSVKIIVGSSERYGMFYYQKLNGSYAFCLTMGGTSRSSYEYKPTLLDNTSLSSSQKKLYRQAYQFMMSNNSELAYEVAQLAIWIGQQSSVSFASPQKLYESIVSAYCSINGYSKCLPESDGYNTITSSKTGRQLSKLTTAFYQTGQYSGKLAVYKTSTVNGAQSLLAPYKCEEDIKKTYACSDNTMKTEMTNCVETQMKNYNQTETYAYNTCYNQYCKTVIQNRKCFYKKLKTGSSAVCNFTNKNNEGNFYEYVQKSCKNTANQYGSPEEYLVDGTCRFYCLESATQSFPGNVAPALSKGTILVWPTSATNTISLKKDIYPLTYTGNRTCKLIMDGSDDDIYEKESPIDRYNNYFSYVRAHYADKETVSSVSNKNVASFSHTKLTYEQIRTKYGVSESLTQKPCNTYYKDIENTLDTAITSAKATRTNWVNNNTGKCSDTKSKPNCVQTKYEDCKIVTARDCTDADYPHNDEINALEAVKADINKSKNSCIVYINNFVGMAGTYVQVASCNNLTIDKNSLYNFETDAAMSFDGPDGTETVTLDKISEVYTCSTNNCIQANKLTTAESNTASLSFYFNNYNQTQFANLVNSINDKGGSRERLITIEADVTYSLPSGSITEDKGNGNYTVANYNGFKISKNSSVGVKYNLNVYNTVLGHNNVFGDLLNKDYVCTYEVTETTTDDCICPEGTINSGKDLFCMISDNGMTCADAKLQYCNDSSITIPDTCSEERYCLNDPSKDLSPCINTGYSYDYCENLICNGGKQSKYTCKNTNNVGGKMDITSCVMTKMAQGLSESDAIDKCDSLVCPIKGGLRIIYRTISLENPFPGKNITGGVKGFNTDVNGRYPGSNWNSQTLVKNHIRYSRTKDSSASYGSKIYQNEEPLYTFVLNASTINAIRNYNETHSYDDFELDCKNNNSTACVSSFVHNAGLSGLTGGDCAYSTSKNNFYRCSDDA